MNATIKITPEVPVDMTLAFVEGKPVKHGNMMFSTTDGRSLFVPEAAGREIQRRLNDLRIKAGDRVLIQQTVSYDSGSREVSWKVYRACGLVGQQASGEFVVPSQPGAAAAPATSLAAAQSNIITQRNSTIPLSHSGKASDLRDTANMLIDVVASCRAYAAGKVSDADVLALVLAAFAKGGAK